MCAEQQRFSPRSSQQRFSSIHSESSPSILSLTEVAQAQAGADADASQCGGGGGGGSASFTRDRARVRQMKTSSPKGAAAAAGGVGGCWPTRDTHFWRLLLWWLRSEVPIFARHLERFWPTRDGEPGAAAGGDAPSLAETPLVAAADGGHAEACSIAIERATERERQRERAWTR